MSQQVSHKDSPDYWIDEINKIILTDPLSPESRGRLENLKAYLFELSDLATSQTASNDRRQEYDIKLFRGMKIRLRKESYEQNYRDWAAALVWHLNEPDKKEARKIRKAIRDCSGSLNPDSPLSARLPLEGDCLDEETTFIFPGVQTRSCGDGSGLKVFLS